jgi:hypothetical protein
MMVGITIVTGTAIFDLHRLLSLEYKYMAMAMANSLEK